MHLQARAFPILFYFWIVRCDEAEDLPDALLALILLNTEFPTLANLLLCIDMFIYETVSSLGMFIFTWYEFLFSFAVVGFENWDKISFGYFCEIFRLNLISLDM